MNKLWIDRKNWQQLQVAEIENYKIFQTLHLLDFINKVPKLFENRQLIEAEVDVIATIARDQTQIALALQPPVVDNLMHFDAPVGIQSQHALDQTLAVGGQEEGRLVRAADDLRAQRIEHLRVKGQVAAD